MSKLGPILRRVRLLKNVNQKTVAKLLNISHSQINKIEHGVNEPTETNTLKILFFLLPHINLKKELDDLQKQITLQELENENFFKEIT